MPLRVARGLLGRECLLDDQLTLVIIDVATDLLLRRPLARIAHRLS